MMVEQLKFRTVVGWDYFPAIRENTGAGRGGGGVLPGVVLQHVLLQLCQGLKLEITDRTRVLGFLEEILPLMHGYMSLKSTKTPGTIWTLYTLNLSIL